MREHRLEVADVFRTYEKEFFAKWGHVIGAHQRKVFEAIRDCRTAALGGHVSMWSNAIRADIRSSPITRAATGIARNARRWRALNG